MVAVLIATRSERLLLLKINCFLSGIEPLEGRCLRRPGKCGPIGLNMQAPQGTPTEPRSFFALPPPGAVVDINS
jgi:hypothetical protein